MGSHTCTVQLLGKPDHSAARHKAFKYMLYPLGFLRDYNHRLVRLFGITKRSNRKNLTPLCGKCHFGRHFLRQTDRVKLIHPFYDSLNQAAEDAVSDFFRDRDNFHVTFFLKQIFVQNAFFLVTGKTRELPYEDNIKRRRFALSLSNHSHKSRPFICFSSTYADIGIYVIRTDNHTVSRSISLSLGQLAVRTVLSLFIC